jgi:hypothetical protein
VNVKFPGATQSSSGEKFWRTTVSRYGATSFSPISGCLRLWCHRRH